MGGAHLVDAWVCVGAMTRVCEAVRVWDGGQEGRAPDQMKRTLYRWILLQTDHRCPHSLNRETRKIWERADHSNESSPDHVPVAASRVVIEAKAANLTLRNYPTWQISRRKNPLQNHSDELYARSRQTSKHRHHLHTLATPGYRATASVVASEVYGKQGPRGA